MWWNCQSTGQRFHYQSSAYFVLSRFDFNPDDTGIDDRTAHPLDTLPMVEIMDNSERLGVFDDVISITFLIFSFYYIIAY